MGRKAAASLASLGLALAAGPHSAEAFVVVAPSVSSWAPSSASQQLRGLRSGSAAETGPRSSAPSFPLGAACLATVAAAAVGLRAGRRPAGKECRAPASMVQLRAKVGDKVPNVGLDKGFPPEKVMLADFCKGKKVVLVGLPGAFTPT
ncbi:unnamed protein product [Polarella glacialis]|uniref:Redoxin domain-containing protein n=1 Tax=Polarella glacialis TaxID=89957 RepID=A0A813ID02_POLGL|nr:unnamed protein product [Polarella glacialis]CAE8647819.1 unnamed protein product [Polarella glacialis]